MLDLAPVLRQLESQFDRSVERYKDFLRIPSISTDPAFKEDTRRAALWLKAELEGLGFKGSLHDTPGHPVLVMEHPGPADAQGPHLLYYGHYDVQPPDPLDLWHSPPFEPTIVEAQHGPRMVARGAVDDKGQVMTFLEAFRGWHAVHGTMPARITVLIEGEEETGSPNLPAFLDGNRDLLKADVSIVTDTNSWDIGTPAITYMLRGLLYVEVTLQAASRDLHSGLYGGSAINPINELTRVLGALHAADGKVAIPGFYDDVEEVGANELAVWQGLGFDEARFLADIELTSPTGEKDRSGLERLWSRPTCDINGIWGGYTGAGAKTVIAAKASAKLSCRLVASQDPEKIMAGIRTFLDARTPPGCRWVVQSFGMSPGIRVATDSPYMHAAQDGLRDVFGKPPVLVGSGGSIPVVGWIQHYLGLESILVGFGLEDDRIHSPNEKFELKCLQNGIMSHATILAKMAGISGA